MNYQEIQGWFNFEEVYRHAVTANDNCSFLEIGAWLGKSTAFMAKLIKSQGKNIKLHVVDFWADSGNESQYDKILGQKRHMTLYEEFTRNMKECGVQDVITPFKGTSDSFFESIKDSGMKFNFIYIDGAHEYSQVKRDIENALKYIAPGGTIAGHDYYYGDVNKAVHELLGSVETLSNTWIYKTNV